MPIVEITKEEYDKIKQKELEQSGMDVYDAVDDPQDADEIISNMDIADIEDVESADIDAIQPDSISVTESGEKYTDTSITNKPGNQSSGKVVTCSEINSSNFATNFKLSAHFTIHDLSTRIGHVIRDTKTVNGVTYNKFDIACNLKALCENVLEKIYNQYSTYGMDITSAYRNRGGSSQHEIGQAADVRFLKIPQKDYINVANWIQSNVSYDQLLFEFREPNSVWIHVSWNPKGNRGVSAPYPKYATFLNDITYKRLQIVNVPGFTYRA